MINPSKIAKESESSHQCAFFAYCSAAYLHGFDNADDWCDGLPLPQYDESIGPAEPALEWIHAVPNGGGRGDTQQTGKVRGGKMRAEGLRAGVPDVFLPHPSGTWHGLYIEFKKPSVKPKTNRGKGGLSNDQIRFREYARKTGYGFVVAYSWKEAVEVVKMYLNWEKGQ